MTVNVTCVEDEDEAEDEDKEFDRELLLEADMVIVVLEITSIEGPEDVELEEEIGV